MSAVRPALFKPTRVCDRKIAVDFDVNQRSACEGATPPANRQGFLGGVTWDKGMYRHIEHMFDMKERTLTLRGGRFDGKTVQVDAKAVEVWAYQNMYNQARAVRAGGFPRSESMVTYRVLTESDFADLVEGG